MEQTSESSHSRALRGKEVDELKRWKLVAKEVGTRSGDQCWKRWNDSLDPNLTHSPWTSDEDEKLQTAVESMGRCWSRIAATRLRGRSGLACKNRMDHLYRRKRRAQMFCDRGLLRHRFDTFARTPDIFDHRSYTTFERGVVHHSMLLSRGPPALDECLPSNDILNATHANVPFSSPLVDLTRSSSSNLQIASDTMMMPPMYAHRNAYTYWQAEEADNNFNDHQSPHDLVEAYEPHFVPSSDQITVGTNSSMVPHAYPYHAIDRTAVERLADDNSHTLADQCDIITQPHTAYTTYPLRDVPYFPVAGSLLDSNRPSYAGVERLPVKSEQGAYDVDIPYRASLPLTMNCAHEDEMVFIRPKYHYDTNVTLDSISPRHIVVPSETQCSSPVMTRSASVTSHTATSHAAGPGGNILDHTLRWHEQRTDGVGLSMPLQRDTAFCDCLSSGPVEHVDNDISELHQDRPTGYGQERVDDDNADVSRELWRSAPGTFAYVIPHLDDGKSNVTDVSRRPHTGLTDEHQAHIPTCSPRPKSEPSLSAFSMFGHASLFPSKTSSDSNDVDISLHAQRRTDGGMYTGTASKAETNDAGAPSS